MTTVTLIANTLFWLARKIEDFLNSRTEENPGTEVFTLDRRDFTIYRTASGKPLDLIAVERTN